MKNFIKDRLIWNYRLRRFLRAARVRPQLHAAPVILVYTMGKVGSSSICKAVQHQDRQRIAYHLHFLNHGTLAAMERYESDSYPIDRKIYDHILLGRQIRTAMDSGYDFKRNIKIITGIRDVVAVDISSFFQTLDRLRTFEYSRIFSDKPDLLLEDLNELFVERISNNSRLPGDQWLSWFDSELMQVMGLDVFATPFPTRQGWQVYCGENHPDTLLIRLENLHQGGRNACRDFLRVNGELNIPPVNIGSNKAYANAYTYFKENVRLPVDYLDEVYSSRVMRHFYEPDEIQNFRNQWKTL